MARSNSTTSPGAAAVVDTAGTVAGGRRLAPAPAAMVGRGVVLLDESAGDAAPLVTEEAMDEGAEGGRTDMIDGNDVGNGAATEEAARGGAADVDIDAESDADGGNVWNANSPDNGEDAAPRAASSLARSSCSDSMSRSD
jgi:hypothetical protein